MTDKTKNTNNTSNANSTQNKTQSTQTSTKPPKIKTGRFTASLAFLISLAACAVALYPLGRQYFPELVPDLIPLENQAEAKINFIEKTANDNAKTIAAMQQLIANSAQNPDKEEVSRLIASTVADYARQQAGKQDENAQTINQKINDSIAEIAQKLQAQIDKNQAEIEAQIREINNKPQAEIDEAKLEELVSKAAANQAAKAAVDPEALQNLVSRAVAREVENIQAQTKKLEEELASAKQNLAQNQGNNASSEELAAQIAKIKELEAAIEQNNQENQKLSAQISALTEASANQGKKGKSADIDDLSFNLLKAESAANQGRYKLAAEFLARAEQNCEDQELQAEIAAAGKVFANLPERDGLILQLTKQVQTVNSWTFKKVTNKTANTEQVDLNGETIADTAKNVGGKILHSTFKVVHNDEAGLNWLGEHPDLQNIVRENIVIDFDFCRNAILFGDRQVTAATLENLKVKINRYFEKDAQTTAAIAAIDEVIASLSEKTPDISALISRVKQ